MTTPTVPSTYELSVLRAMLRLARRRSPADLEQLLVRVGGTAPDLRATMRTLERAGLVERRPAEVALGRLTMEGFAVAVAAVAARRAERVKAVRTEKKHRARRRAA